MKNILRGSVLLLVLLVGFYLVKRALYVPSAKNGPLMTRIAKKGPFRFFALGDTGDGNKNQISVAIGMEKKCQQLGGIDGIFLLGDNFYKTGVSSIDDPQWQEKLEKPYNMPCLRGAKIYPVLGNHDYRGNTNAQIRYGRLNARWHMPGRFYSVQFGNIFELIAIDTGFPDFCFLPEHCSLDYLHSRLRNPDGVKWQVVAAHHPLSSASIQGRSHGGGFPGFIFRQFACNRADGWLAGHAHHLEHRILPGCPADIFISGGGGADLYGVNQEPESRFAVSCHGFLYLHADSEALTFTFLDKKANDIYSFAKKS